MKGKLRPKEKQVREARRGCFDEVHKTLLKVYWEQYRFLSLQLEALERKIAEAMADDTH